MILMRNLVGLNCCGPPGSETLCDLPLPRLSARQIYAKSGSQADSYYWKTLVSVELSTKASAHGRAQQE